jgi:hypothetical protein
LAWTRTRGSLMVLQLIFAMTYTNLDDDLLFAKRIVVRVLRNHPMARVQGILGATNARRRAGRAGAEGQLEGWMCV